MLAAASCATVFAATPQVTSVTMSQPSSGRQVNIDYTFTGADAVITLDVQTNATGGAWVSIGGEAVCNAKGAVWKRVTNDGSTHHITWRPDYSWPDHVVADGGARAVITAWTLDNTPDYMVVDLSSTGGAGTEKYYPAVDFLPGSVPGQKGAITNNVAYKTSLLVMRKIMASGVEWIMGSVNEGGRRTNENTHNVTLTNNYYIGVFEVTQTQWMQIWPEWLGDNNRGFGIKGAYLPVNKVCYNEIRNSGNTTEDPANNWPNPPSGSSFLGRLNNRTGLVFDLPSDAQWEFAARAGTGDNHWNDGSEMLLVTGVNTTNDVNLAECACYKYNQPNGNSPTDVGIFRPNAWGLYDMHGNISEACLDWYQGTITSYNGVLNINPANPAQYVSGSGTPTERISRGGGYSSSATDCRSARRVNIDPSSRGNGTGLRLYCTAGLK